LVHLSCVRRSFASMSEPPAMTRSPSVTSPSMLNSMPRLRCSAKTP
jgi:hypothetical protein